MTTFAIHPVITAHRQASLDASTPVNAQALTSAIIRNHQNKPLHVRGVIRSRLYNETPERAQWRALFDAAAALPGVAMAVTFIKDGGETRTMLCKPLSADAEYTKRYALVVELDTEAHKRINLDAIVKVTLETHSLEG